VPGESRPRLDPVETVPQRRPSTTIGLAATELSPSARAIAGMRAELGSSTSTRAARPVSRTDTTAPWGSRLMRVPSSGCANHLWAPNNVACPSGSNRHIAVASVWKSAPASSATAPNTRSGPTPRATRVATRRNADCSCDRRAPSNATRRDRAASSPTTTAVTRNTPMAASSRESGTRIEWMGGRNR